MDDREFTDELRRTMAQLTQQFTTSDKQLHFRSALASRDIIDQAQGMIMERFGVDAVRAFELSVKLSKTTNTPVADIAPYFVARGPDTRSRF